MDANDKIIIQKIECMSHEEMAKLWRFAPSGHIYFDIRLPFWEVFEKRWNEFGGWNSKLSKKIGLG